MVREALEPMQARVSLPESLNAEQRRLFDYWMSKRRDGVLPARADIDPADLGPMLPLISLVDVERRGRSLRYRSRLIGTSVVEKFGRDVTGCYADEIYKGGYLEQLEELYSDIVERGEPALCTCEVPFEWGPPLVYERLLLPLASDGRTVDMVICLFAFDDSLPGKRWRLPVARSTWQVRA